MAAIKHLFHIAAPQEEVYRAISTLEGLRGWWTARATGDAGTGGVLHFRFGGYGPDMKVREMHEDRSASWECTGGFEDWTGTMITFKLDRNDQKTRVRFEHAGWKEAGDAYASCSFGWGRYLESLRLYCETGKGDPFRSKGESD